MSTATEFTLDDLPPDEPPALERGDGEPFDPRYPDSTPDAPFGFKADGTPYTRHHGGRAGKSSSGTGRANASSTKQGEQAAAMLSRMNMLFGIALTAAGMPKAANQLASNNSQFEAMAANALSADPKLCKKILSTGAVSGKTGLIVAYAMLGASVVPVMRDEYRETHPKEIEGEEYA